jgi:hypothetical protein
VVICSPIQSELLKNNRREVLLSRRLAAEGVAVQRFHYRGTGNSDGEASSMTVAGMVEDATAAAECLLETAGASRLCFMGTRLGAIVAATTAARFERSDLAFWEPVPDGKRYFRDLVRSRLVTDLRRGEQITSAEHLAGFEKAGVLDVSGFSIGWALYADAVERALVPPADPGRNILFVHFTRSGEARPEHELMSEAWAAPGNDVTTRQVSYQEAWWIHQDVNVLTPHVAAEMQRAIVDITVDWFNRD